MDNYYLKYFVFILMPNTVYPICKDITILSKINDKYRINNISCYDLASPPNMIMCYLAFYPVNTMKQTNLKYDFGLSYSVVCERWSKYFPLTTLRKFIKIPRHNISFSTFCSTSAIAQFTKDLQVEEKLAALGQT